MLRVEEHRFVSWDGTELFYRSWTPEGEAERAVILFHRGHEHSARWQDVIDKLDLPGTRFFAWDARGHGRSPGERGHAPSFATLVRDVDAFVRHVATTSGIPHDRMVIMAHSVGSVLVSAWVHDYAPPVRALVLGSPALRVRLYVPLAVPGLRLLQRLRGTFFISSYVKGRLLTHDPAKQRSYDTDPLVTPQISVNILLGLHDAATRVMEDAGAITPPVLILRSGADFVVEQWAQRRFYDRLPSLRKEMQSFPGFLHDTFNELGNERPIAKARMFIEDAFARPLDRPNLADADRGGHTHQEFLRLSQPLPWYRPKALGFAAMRLAFATIGRLSRGISIGLESGFDSGAMLDYVYRNQAEGIGLPGRLMDRAYLDSPGWKGIRQRKVNLERRLAETIARVVAETGEARIADIAAGHGRYVLDVLRALADQPVSALLRDFSPGNVGAGRALIAEMGLSRVSFEKGDAFDAEAVAALPNRPNIGIVSGLYELFPDNDRVRSSLAGLARAIQPGGYLIYTNQPWHPQLELIARVLTSHKDGRAWVMRRRTQQEMDQLVAEAGFRKLGMDIDDDGIFTVSVAVRTPPHME